jgi:AcrR family transcriptional regulator
LSKQSITTGSPSTEATTRDRIVTAAIRLFAERGYRGTTVGEIEAAAGLSPRAGGLYKHFASKEEVLEAGIERHVSELEAMRPTLETMPFDDLRRGLELVARWALGELADEMPLMKIVQKDGDRFPELAAEVHERIVARGHRDAEELVRRIMGDAAAGREANFAAVALNSLVGYRLEQTMFAGRVTVPEEDFIQTWVEIVATYSETTRRRARRRRGSEVVT